jgi:hypothetical protein
MNFSQLHERLRAEIVRRIDRGILTGTLLARQTGLRPSHISNFIRGRRKLSLAALDRVLAVQVLSIDDLMPFNASRAALESAASSDDYFDSVPLVSHTTAMYSPRVTRKATIEIIKLPAGILEQMRPRRAIARREWQRFIAVRISPAQALPMSPILAPYSVVVLDRHYNSFVPYQPLRLNVYGVAVSDTLIFRYVSFDANRVILRPYALEHPIELLEPGIDESPFDCITGRVCLCISEI